MPLTLPPFAMWPAFPTSNYYGDSVPGTRPTPTMGVPFAVRQEGATIRVTTFTDFRLQGSVPSYTTAASPCTTRSHVHDLGASISLRGHQAGVRDRIARSQHCSSPDPPGSSCRRLKGPQPLVHFRCTFPSCLRGRGVWQCRRSATLSGLLPVLRASPRSTCPQLLATTAMVAGGHGRSPR